MHQLQRLTTGCTSGDLPFSSLLWIATNHLPQSRSQVFEVGGQGKNCHDLLKPETSWLAELDQKISWTFFKFWKNWKKLSLWAHRDAVWWSSLHLLVFLLRKLWSAQPNLHFAQVLVTWTELARCGMIHKWRIMQSNLSPLCQGTAISDSFPCNGVWVNVKDAEFLDLLLEKWEWSEGQHKLSEWFRQDKEMFEAWLRQWWTNLQLKKFGVCNIKSDSRCPLWANLGCAFCGPSQAFPNGHTLLARTRAYRSCQQGKVYSKCLWQTNCSLVRQNHIQSKTVPWCPMAEILLIDILLTKVWQCKYEHGSRFLAFSRTA